jgi:hypothetical protein
VRITAARGYMLEPDDVMYVAEVAREQSLSIEVENNGLSLS